MLRVAFSYLAQKFIIESSCLYALINPLAKLGKLFHAQDLLRQNSDTLLLVPDFYGYVFSVVLDSHDGR
jgi:hypothetical protein